MNAAARRPSFAADPARRAMLAKMHLAKKELGLSEEDYRAVLTRITGLSSAAEMRGVQLEDCLREFGRLGWQKKPGKGRGADHPGARKARALWISLHQLGVVRNGADSALEAFARRQLGCAKLQWADQAQVYKLTEALKAMATRNGWSQDLTGIEPEHHTLELQRRLVARLHKLLTEESPGPVETLNGYARHFTGGSTWHNLWPANLQKMAALLAQELATVRQGDEAA